MFFSYQRGGRGRSGIFRQYPTNRKKVILGFRRNVAPLSPKSKMVPTMLPPHTRQGEVPEGGWLAQQTTYYKIQQLRS